MQICPNCGEENPDRFRLCGFCGTGLAPDIPVEEVRRTVSIVFSDLKDSTALGERLDSEHLREVLNVYFNEMRLVLERHGGRVEKYIGDAIMSGLPFHLSDVCGYYGRIGRRDCARNSRRDPNAPAHARARGADHRGMIGAAEPEGPRAGETLLRGRSRR